MPSVSKKQRRVMAIAEHAPAELYPKDRGLLKMSHQQLHDFASTKEKGLPLKVKPLEATKPVPSPKVKPPKVEKVKAPSAAGEHFLTASSYGKAKPKAEAVHPFIHHSGGKGF